ncbi:MAG: glutathione S-transferase N-terminal domain-containing protein [Myxococcota bacterium]
MNLVLCELADASAFGVPSLSPFCLKAHAALRFARLPYERRHAERPDAWRAHNPTGQVPVLLDGGRPVADSTAIVRRVLELAPGALGASPEAWLYEELADTAINGFLVAARWADDENWPRTCDAYFSAMPAPIRWVVPGMLRRGVLASLGARDVWRAGAGACWDRFERLLDQLDGRAPAAGFWCGDGPSVADVGLYGQLRSFGTSLTPRQAAAVQARPRLAGWLARVERASTELSLAA